MGIVWSGLAPHPPIIVPEVGRNRCKEVANTISAMHALFSQMMACEPRRLVLISPHTPRPQRGISGWLGDTVHGHFGPFGAPEAALELPNDRSWMATFRNHYTQLTPLYSEVLDHGALVPLYFATAKGWDGPTSVIGLPWDEEHQWQEIAQAIAAASDDPVPTALLASGDMSHCLKPGAPCPFDQRGPRFDQFFVDALKQADFKGALTVDPDLRQAARQDVLESCRIAWQANGFRNDNHQFHHYEGPFGVGYSVMTFFQEKNP